MTSSNSASDTPPGRRIFGFRSPEAARFPEMVVCGIAFRCNARCIHCPNAATHFKATLQGDEQLMSWATLRKVADECAPHPHCMIRVSSCGEVLMHPEAVEMMEHLLERKQDRNVALTTNGALLTADKSERLLAAGIRSIELSMDAHRAETYGQIRVGLSFPEVHRNLDDLVALRDRLGVDTQIFVSVIEQPANQAELEEIRRYWEGRVDKVLVRRLLTFGGIIERQQQYAPQLEQGAPCPFLWERVLIDAQGDIRGCVSDLYNRSRLGNVHEQTIAEVWQAEPLRSWRALHLDGRPHEAGPCGGCLDMEYRTWDYSYFAAYERDEPDGTP